MSSPSVSAETTQRHDYKITHLSFMEIETTVTYYSGDASELREMIDEDVGDGDGFVSYTETLQALYEMERGAGDQYPDFSLNSVQGTIQSVDCSLAGAEGNTWSTDTITFTCETYINFAGMYESSAKEITLDFGVSGSASHDIFNEFYFHGYSVTSLSGLSSPTVVEHENGDIVKGFLVPGQNVHIEFQEREESQTVLFIVSAIIIISILLLIYRWRKMRISNVGEVPF
jgi:hypothetical protein